MTRFLDGPAAGKTMQLRRAPLLLRVVEGPDGFDALDLLEDEPLPEERIWVYRLVAHEGFTHVHTGNGLPREHLGRWLAIAEYRLASEQPDEQVLRHTSSWRRWANEYALRSQWPVSLSGPSSSPSNGHLHRG